MVQKIYCLYDSKAEAFLQPMFIPNLGLCLRSLQNALDKPDSHIAKYVDDYSLFELGEWDDNTAEITMLTAHKKIGQVRELTSNTNSQSPTSGDRRVPKVETQKKTPQGDLKNVGFQ
jgi:hypothetical protein